jgi:hypothetical protein
MLVTITPILDIDRAGRQAQSGETQLIVPLHRTIDRRLVHREALGEVFVADVAEAGEDQFLVTAQLPRLHAYYGDHLHRRPMFDPVLLVEAARQAGLCLAHQYFGVPAEHKFILTRLELRVDRPKALLIGLRPGELELRAAILKRQERDGQVTGLDYRFALTDRAHGSIGVAVVGLRFKSPGGYAALRARRWAGQSLPSTADYRPRSQDRLAEPRQVGRRDERNVVITQPALVDDAMVADLFLPVTHASMFDHAQDHVPGMVLIEAARQIAVAAVTERYGYAVERVLVRAASAQFSSFGELPSTTRVVATVGHAAASEATEPIYTAGGVLDGEAQDRPRGGGSHNVRVTAFQDGEPITRVDLVLNAPFDADRATA